MSLEKQFTSVVRARSLSGVGTHSSLIDRRSQNFRTYIKLHRSILWKTQHWRAPFYMDVLDFSAKVKLPHAQEDIRITAPNVTLETIPTYLSKNCILFHYPETERLAHAVANASESRVELGEIKWG